MKITAIYGASDDLIEIDREISEEINWISKEGEKKTIAGSDGTTAKIHYNKDGVWQIDITNKGNLFMEKINSVGDDNDHKEPYENYSSYSDILVFKSGLEWVKIGNKKIK